MVNTYLEDERQLDQVYQYLKELYTHAIATAPDLKELKFIDLVPFVLDVLLPEVSALTAVFCWGWLDWRVKGQMSPCPGHHLRHSRSGQHLAPEGGGEVPERAICQCQVRESSVGDLCSMSNRNRVFFVPFQGESTV